MFGSVAGAGAAAATAARAEAAASAAAGIRSAAGVIARRLAVADGAFLRVAHVRLRGGAAFAEAAALALRQVDVMRTAAGVGVEGEVVAAVIGVFRRAGFQIGRLVARQDAAGRCVFAGLKFIRLQVLRLQLALLRAAAVDIALELGL